MKKYQPVLFAAALFMLLFISWGNAGHRVIAHIAETYLTAYAKDSIKNLLGNETLEDAAVWADKITADPKYKNTIGWHYIDLPPGLTDGFPSGFRDAVYGKHNLNASEENIYTDLYHAIRHQSEVIKDSTSTKTQKATALKFLLNLVANANEPMYICRAWNWEGNSTQKDVDDSSRKLQTGYEDNLINVQGRNYAETAAKINQAAHPKGGRLVINDPVWWLRDSYEAGERLYASAEKNNRPDSEYYQEESTTMVNDQLEQAGIRLADLLNALFKPPYKKGDVIKYLDQGNAVEYKASPYVLKIPVQKAARFIGIEVSLDARVFGVKNTATSIELYLGAQYPNQFLTIILQGSRSRALAKNILDKTITITGTPVINNGRTEIVMEDANIIVKQ